MTDIALIPVYCPEDRMVSLVKELKARGFSIVVIDDGSGAEYDAVFDAVQPYAEVRRYSPNRGKGEALKCGLRLIADHFQPPYTVVTADADGQHRVEDIIKVCEQAVQHPESLILGKRTLNKTAPIKSRIGNGLTRVFYHLSTGRKVYETQTGLRAFSDKLLPHFLNLPGHRYEYEIEVMLQASDTDIIETDIETVYFDNNSASHFRPFIDTVSLNKEFFRYKLPSLTAGAVGYLLFAVLTALSGDWLLPSVISRMFTLLLKYVLNKAVLFSEKAPVSRFWITALILLLCDTGIMGGLTAIGMNIYVAKLISCTMMIVIGAVVRKIFMLRKYR